MSSLTDSVIQLEEVSKIKKLDINESSFCYAGRLKDMEDLEGWPGPVILEDEDEVNDMIVAVRNKLYVFEKNIIGIIEELNEKRIELEEDIYECVKMKESMKEFMEETRKEIKDLKNQVNCLMSNQKN
jgi:hypothetical protein